MRPFKVLGTIVATGERLWSTGWNRTQSNVRGLAWLRFRLISNEDQVSTEPTCDHEKSKDATMHSRWFGRVVSKAFTQLVMKLLELDLVDTF